jgi:hypothetical protein
VQVEQWVVCRLSLEEAWMWSGWEILWLMLDARAARRMMQALTWLFQRRL